MSETGVVVPEAAQHPSIVHEPTRRALSGCPGLRGHGPVSFHPLTAPQPQTVRDHLTAKGGDPAEPKPELELVLIGHLILEGEPTGDEVVLDGANGRVFSMWMFEDAPSLAKLLPLAPSVAALGRLLDMVDAFRARRGPFAVLAGRTGPDAVRDARPLLHAAIAEEDWDEEGSGPAVSASDRKHAIPAFWRIAAEIRPLGLIAGPGRGLALDLPPGLLDEEFGADEIIRISADRAPGPGP
ncbi:hypothetical protein ACFYT4_31680 [Streptomyces sp. NPDC004609]|uniref:hypothetical protein n=1 Tax=Streptomyces sp. NPDC004609 TaxID=3364704 RepID=UPI0036A9746B